MFIPYERNATVCFPCSERETIKYQEEIDMFLVLKNKTSKRHAKPISDRRSYLGYIKKGEQWRYMTHAVYYRLAKICPKHAEAMLEELKSLPEDQKYMLDLFSKEGYTVKDLAQTIEGHRNLFYRKAIGLGKVLKYLYAYRIVAKKYVALCFEEAKPENCKSIESIQTKKIFF